MFQSNEGLSPLEQPEMSHARKAYRAPHLRDYGDVRELTQTNAVTLRGTDAGVTPPNIYAS